MHDQIRLNHFGFILKNLNFFFFKISSNWFLQLQNGISIIPSTTILDLYVNWTFQEEAHFITNKKKDKNRYIPFIGEEEKFH